jgi:hypothetical protein
MNDKSATKSKIQKKNTKPESNTKIEDFYNRNLSRKREREEDSTPDVSTKRQKTEGK